MTVLQEVSDQLSASTSPTLRDAEYRRFPKGKLERDASVASVVCMAMTSFQFGRQNFRLHQEVTSG